MELPGLVYGLGLVGNAGEHSSALKVLNLSHLHPWPVPNIPGYLCFVKLYFSFFRLSSFYFVGVFLNH